MSRHPFFPSDLARGWCATRWRVGSCVQGVISPRKARGVYNAGRRGQAALKDAWQGRFGRCRASIFGAFSVDDFPFGKTKSMLPCFDVPSTIPTCLVAGDRFFEPVEKAKYLDVDTLGLDGLQPIEISQNGQSFLWKSLEINSRILEKLAK